LSGTMNSCSFSPALRHSHTRCESLSTNSNLVAAERFRVRVLPRSVVSRVFMGFKIRKGKKGRETEYPWPEKVGGNLKDGYLRYLSSFKPMSTKPKPFLLPFERPIADIEKKIAEVRDLAKETGMDFSEQILELEKKYEQVVKDLYAQLTPIQRLSVARHPNRPTFLDHVFNITDKWVELHGDRAGYDDPAIVTGIGSIDGISFMFIGHQKGRNTKENIHRNFAMPTPHGYRKALRMMKHADHHGFPIISFIDTPGAYAAKQSEEKGQGEAIAHNLRSMFSLKVPIVTVVIGEGGSGGALAIGCCNKMLMLENSVYYVASPEACAAILYKSAKAAPKAAEKLRITAQELEKFKITDEVIPEPLGGAHMDPFEASKQIKNAVMKHMHELLQLSPDEVQRDRIAKFRSIGLWQDSEVDTYRKRNMKKRDAPIPEPSSIAAPSLQTLESSLNYKPENMKEDDVDFKVHPLNSSVKTENVKRGDLKVDKTDEETRSTVNASSNHNLI